MSHPSPGSDAVSSSTKVPDAKPAAKGLSPWEHERIRRRAFAMWRDEGFPVTRRREQWGLAQLQMLKSYPSA